MCFFYAFMLKDIKMICIFDYIHFSVQPESAKKMLKSTNKKY